MENFFALFLSFYLSLFNGGAPTDPVTPTDPGNGGGSSSSDRPAGYDALVFDEDFNGNDLDRSVWCTRYIYGGGPALQDADDDCLTSNGGGTLDFLNDERQRYVDYNRSGEAMHLVNNGVLSLRATATRSDDNYAGWESAMIRSKKTFRPSSNTSYFVVARVNLPNVIGTWPAFWLNPGVDADGNTPWPPEIDILEAPLNGIDDTVDMLHQQTQVRGKQTASGDNEFTYQSEDFETTWHNYYSPDGSSLRQRWLDIGATWTTNEVCYYVNGEKTACEDYQWVTNDGTSAPPATLLLNLAIGGQWAGRYGVGDEYLEDHSASEVASQGMSTDFPAEMKIDYVRVYEKR